MKSLISARVKLQRLTLNDAEFIVELLTDPDSLKYIGDRGVRNRADAVAYIQKGPQKMYQQYDMGLLLVTSVDNQTPMGICGLLKRPELPQPDLGFAFLPAFRKQGFALEAAKLVLADAFNRKMTEKVLAITSIDNEKSICLLTKLGFKFKELIDLTQTGDKTKLFELSMNINRD